LNEVEQLNLQVMEMKKNLVDAEHPDTKKYGQHMPESGNIE
jgi:hypothetical protein